MNKRFALLIILLFAFTCSFSQSGSQSPYSRYGLGDIYYGGFTNQLAMGGTSLTQNDSFALNFNNPASYAALRLTVFDLGVFGNFTKYQIGKSKGDRNNGGLAYMAIGFPIIYKKWGTSLGLLPYTSTGYALKSIGLLSDSVPVTNSYTGEGGITRLYWGNGFHVNHNLSLGFNSSFLFGSIYKTRQTEFIEQGYYNSSYKVTSTYNALCFDFGGLYKTDSLIYISKKGFTRYNYRDSITPAGDTIQITTDNLPDELSSMQKKRIKAARWLRLNVGLTGTYSSRTTSDNEVLSNTYKNFGNVPITKDTLLYETGVKNTVNLPSYVALGVSLQDHNHWFVGVDATWQQWSKFMQTAESDTLKNAFKISIGGEIIPKYNSNNFFQRVAYRAGFRYTQTQLEINETRIIEYAGTFGFGIPIRKDNITAAFGNYMSRINVSFEIGKRGTTSNNLLLENFFGVNVGILITEQWFIKKKYD